MSKRRQNFAAEKSRILARLFDTIDANHDLEISWQEFLSFQAKAKMALNANWPFDLSSIRKEFSDMDSDGSGSISKKEFVQVFNNLCDSRSGSTMTYYI